MFKRSSRTPRTVIRGRHLYRILFSGVIFAVIAVGALAFWGVREIRRDAASVAVESSARGLAGAVTVLVNAVTSANDEMNVESLASLNPEVLRPAFIAAFNKHATLAAVMVSNGSGMRYLLTRNPGGLLQGGVRTDGQEADWTLFKGDGTSHPAGPGSRFDRDVVNTVLADEFNHLKPGQVNWRSSYRIHDSGESWITASSLVESNGKRFMLSFIFPIDAVVSQLVGAEKGSAEKVFLFWDSGKVLPIGQGTGTLSPGESAGKVESAGSVSDPVIAAAAERLAADPTLRGVALSYRVGTDLWWSYLLPLSVFGDTMSLGVVVSMKSIVSSLGSDTFLQIFGGSLVVLAGLALFILHRSRARIEALGMRHGAARNGDDVLRLIREGESRGLEFKQTLRFNLKAGKNGKEIEHACMKTVAGFMNSEGGTLLVGVADDGTVTGFEEDNFANGDKALLHFNNLVNQYIGAEFSRYLDTMVIESGGKEVIRAFCMPSSVPAILKTGQSEEFYVRSGPASRQLTLSQFYEWVKNH
jgi:hypothetical protein